MALLHGCCAVPLDRNAVPFTTIKGATAALRIVAKWHSYLWSQFLGHVSKLRAGLVIFSLGNVSIGKSLEGPKVIAPK